MNTDFSVCIRKKKKKKLFSIIGDHHNILYFIIIIYIINTYIYGYFEMDFFMLNFTFSPTISFIQATFNS